MLYAPPDRLLARRPRASHRSTTSSTAGSWWRRRNSIPNSAATKSTFSRAVRSGIEGEQLRHVADLLARPAPEAAWILFEDTDGATRWGEGSGISDDGRSPAPRRTDEAEDRALRDGEGSRPRRTNCFVTSSMTTVGEGAHVGSVTWAPGCWHGGARRTGRASRVSRGGVAPVSPRPGPHTKRMTRATLQARCDDRGGGATVARAISRPHPFGHMRTVTRPIVAAHRQ